MAAALWVQCMLMPFFNLKARHKRQAGRRLQGDAVATLFSTPAFSEDPI